MLTTVETLQKMKDELMVKGWTRAKFEDEDGRVCLLGSLTRSNFLNEADFIEVLEALRQVTGFSILGFNDARGRTFNDIIDVLDKAIMNEKEKVG